VSSVSVEPAEITVHGDPGTLTQLDSVSTHPVSVSGRRAGSFRASVAVQVPHGLHAQYRYVTAYVRLGSASSSASLSLPVVPIHVASGLAAQVRPARVLVTVVGSSKALQGARGVSASVDLSGYSAGTRTAHVHISVPSALRVGQVYPPSLNVRLTKSTK
jgi:YbbR domain-containing protein